jgi:hypothetical protein
MPYKKISGIYQILNTATDKCYIGSGISIKQRFSTHKRLLMNQKHFNNHLQASWNKYGEEHFQFNILEIVESNNLKDREEFYIEKFNSNNREKGYNKRIDCSTNLGIKASAETREKLRISHLGHKRSKEAQEKISKSQYKKVCQFSKKGELINIFDSMQEASLKTNTLKSSISMCCRGIIPSGNKYVWRYEKF